jgi:hypothetical protein
MRSDRNWTLATITAMRDVADGIREFHLKPERGATRFHRARILRCAC